MKWAKIKDHPDYWVSENGDVISLKRKEARILKIGNKKGYLYVMLINTYKSIHRLVANAFIPNPNNLPQINHLDTNKSNNKIANLAWCTGSENMLHAIKHGLISSPNKGKFGKNHPRAKKIIQIKNGIVIKEWDSISDAGRAGFHSGHIGECLTGRIKSSSGFQWEYKI